MWQLGGGLEDHGNTEWSAEEAAASGEAVPELRADRLTVSHLCMCTHMSGPVPCAGVSL